jgi:ABC-type amino acid transport system permease subunit
VTRHDIPGLLALLSLMLWTFAGLPSWGQIPPEQPERGFAVFCLHTAAIIYTIARRGIT